MIQDVVVYISDDLTLKAHLVKNLDKLNLAIRYENVILHKSNRYYSRYITLISDNLESLQKVKKCMEQLNYVVYETKSDQIVMTSRQPEWCQQCGQYLTVRDQWGWFCIRCVQMKQLYRGVKVKYYFKGLEQDPREYLEGTYLNFTPSLRDQYIQLYCRVNQVALKNVVTSPDGLTVCVEVTNGYNPETGSLVSETGSLVSETGSLVSETGSLVSETRSSVSKFDGDEMTKVTPLTLDALVELKMLTSVPLTYPIEYEECKPDIKSQSKNKVNKSVPVAKTPISLKPALAPKVVRDFLRQLRKSPLNVGSVVTLFWEGGGVSVDFIETQTDVQELQMWLEDTSNAIYINHIVRELDFKKHNNSSVSKITDLVDQIASHEMVKDTIPSELTKVQKPLISSPKISGSPKKLIEPSHQCIKCFCAAMPGNHCHMCDPNCTSYWRTQKLIKSFCVSYDKVETLMINLSEANDSVSDDHASLTPLIVVTMAKLNVGVGNFKANTDVMSRVFIYETNGLIHIRFAPYQPNFFSEIRFRTDWYQMASSQIK